MITTNSYTYCTVDNRVTGYGVMNRHHHGLSCFVVQNIWTGYPAEHTTVLMRQQGLLKFMSRLQLVIFALVRS